MSASYKNSLGRSQETVWIPYQNGVNGSPSISFHYNTIISKYTDISAKGISWNNGRALLDRANFIKWYNDGALADMNRSVN